MSLIKCPECGKEISDRADACPICGYPLKQNKQTKEPMPPPDVTFDTMRNSHHQQNSPKEPFYKKMWFIFLLLLLIPPVGLIFVWVHKKPHNMIGRLILTGFFILYCIAWFSAFGDGKKDSPTSSTPQKVTESTVKKKKTKKNKEKQTNSTITETEISNALVETEVDNVVTETSESTTEAINPIDIFYLDLYTNYENYMDKYVTISGPIDYISDDNSFNIKEGIDGFTGMITIELAKSYKTNVGEYVTVTGKIKQKTIGYLYMEDAIVTDSGAGAKDTYSNQKSAYDDTQVQKQKADAEAKKSEVEKFVSECQTYDYDQLRRNPNDYIGAKIAIRLKIQQQIDGGFLDNSTYYRCNENDEYDMWMGNEYLIEDADAYKSSNILPDDIVTIYGEYTGTQEIKRALTGTNEQVPAIKAISIELNQ